MNEFAKAWAFTIHQREVAARSIEDMCDGNLLEAKREKYIHNTISCQI